MPVFPRLRLSAHRPPRHRHPLLRRVRLALAVLRRTSRAITRRLILLSGWTWVAAGSLVGFEVLEILLGSMALAPEFIPLAIIGLACAWFFRERLRRLGGRVLRRIRATRPPRRPGS